MFSLPVSSNNPPSNPSPTDELRVDWKGLADGQVTRGLLDGHAISHELLGRVRKEFGNAAAVACLGPRGSWAFDRAVLWQTNSQAFVDPSLSLQQQQLLAIQQSQLAAMQQQQIQFARMQAGAMQNYSTAQLPADIQQQAGLFRWIYQNSVAVPRGLFGLVSGIAPKGGPDLDDLPLYDPSDTAHALLIVIVPRGDDLIVYRKLVKCDK